MLSKHTFIYIFFFFKKPSSIMLKMSSDSIIKNCDDDDDDKKDKKQNVCYLPIVSGFRQVLPFPTGLMRFWFSH